jgi:hypothetical protein
MPQYNESTAQGTVWNRCDQIVIQNPYLGLEKFAVFSEEDVVVIGGTTILNKKRHLRKTFIASEVIQIRDPVTGTLTGSTITHQELYNILHSLYIQTSIERDEISNS